MILEKFRAKFLIDDSIVDNIANAIDYKENNMVIEIGPGSGNLTKKIA